MVIFAADDRSSDTVVLGSDAPLTFDLERLQRVWQLEAVPDRMSVPDQLERAAVLDPGNAEVLKALDYIRSKKP